MSDSIETPETVQGASRAHGQQGDLGLHERAWYQLAVGLGEDSHHERALVRRAAAGERDAARAIVVRLAPVVQRGVTRVLLRRRARRTPTRQELEDLVQDVFVSLFAQGGRELLRWDPRRGLKLESFVGLVAQRLAISTLRAKRSAAQRQRAAAATEPADVASTPDDLCAAREDLSLLGARLRATLSPFGLEMFERLFVREQSVELICQQCGMKPDAVYQWRTRLRHTVGDIRDTMSGAPASGAARSER